MTTEGNSDVKDLIMSVVIGGARACLNPFMRSEIWMNAKDGLTYLEGPCQVS